MSSRSDPPIPDTEGLHRREVRLLSVVAVGLAWAAVALAWEQEWAAVPVGLFGTLAAFLAFRQGSIVAARRQAELRREVDTEVARAEEHRLLRELAATLLTFRSPDQLFQEVARVGRGLVESDGAAVLLRAGEDQFLRIAAADGLEDGARGRLVPVEGSVAGAALAAGESVVIERLSSERTFDRLEAGAAFERSAAAPLRSQGFPIGVVAVYNRAGRPPFSPLDVDLLETLAEQVALGLDRAAMLEEARRNERVLEQTNRELVEATQLKTQFLANMSHELRTPLNAIIGFADLLQVEPDPDPVRQDYLASIARNGHHLLGMINGILDAAKFEAGRMTLRRSRFDLRDVIEAAIKDTDSLRAVKSQLCARSLGPDSLAVEADQQKIRQVLFNLLSNATKFTDSGGAITVTAARAPMPMPLKAVTGEMTGVEVREVAWVEVRDTGIGMTPEDRGRLFQPFVQLDGSAARTQPGTGLGLALCRQFVELHGGTIGVESAHGQGSAFWFTLPLADPAAG